jgi:predicted Ser/Thr protein kinase
VTEHPAHPASRAVFIASEPFRQMRPALLDQVFRATIERRFEPGEHVIRQGTAGDALMVVLEGRAEVIVRVEQEQSWPIAEVSMGSVIGEMALVTEDLTTADVVASTPLRALALPSERFHAIAATHPELTIVLTDLVADRLGRSLRDGLGGKVLEGYRIVGCVGRGGMAVVYEAIELATGEHVALKMLSHRLVYRPEFVSRFEREARLLQTLEHANIARLRGTFPAFRTEFMVMEFCAGASLGACLEKHRPFPEDQGRRVLGQIASALAFVHERGIVHRDLKPGNVLVMRSGRVKLTDFGLAKEARPITDDTASLAESTVGTPFYMAPEQMMGDDSGPAADIFAFACLAYEIVAGRRPFDAASLSALQRQKLAFVVPPARDLGRGISEELRELIVRGLDKDPQKRLVSLSGTAAWAADLSADFLPLILAEA